MTIRKHFVALTKSRVHNPDVYVWVIHKI